jgi:hypothetical protein
MSEILQQSAFFGIVFWKETIYQNLQKMKDFEELGFNRNGKLMS